MKGAVGCVYALVVALVFLYALSYGEPRGHRLESLALERGEVIKYYVTGNEVPQVEGYVVYAPLEGEVHTGGSWARVYLLYALDEDEDVVTIES